MCLIAFAYQPNLDHQLVVAANRDEFHERPTAQASFWSTAPNILAGRDLQGGGTWMAVDRAGRFAALTNYSEPVPDPLPTTTRGELITNFLNADVPAEHYLASIEGRAQDYRGFNLLLMDPTGLFYFNNRLNLSKRLSPGYYALSNRYLDCDWPKVTFTRGAIETALIKPEALTLETLMAMMQSNDADAPHSDPFITDGHYGTRATTGLIIDAYGTINFKEQVFHRHGKPGTATAFSFPVADLPDRESKTQGPLA